MMTVKTQLAMAVRSSKEWHDQFSSSIASARTATNDIWHTEKPNRGPSRTSSERSARRYGEIQLTSRQQADVRWEQEADEVIMQAVNKGDIETLECALDAFAKHGSSRVVAIANDVRRKILRRDANAAAPLRQTVGRDGPLLMNEQGHPVRFSLDDMYEGGNHIDTLRGLDQGLGWNPLVVDDPEGYDAYPSNRWIPTTLPLYHIPETITAWLSITCLFFSGLDACFHILIPAPGEVTNTVHTPSQTALSKPTLGKGAQG